MRVGALIERLQFLQKEHGEMDVLLDVSGDGLIEIGEIDVDMEDTGIIIWRKDEDENESHLVICPSCSKVYTAMGCHECPSCLHDWNEVMA